MSTSTCLQEIYEATEFRNTRHTHIACSSHKKESLEEAHPQIKGEKLKSKKNHGTPCQFKKKKKKTCHHV